MELIGPERGEMAEGEHGLGRMTEPAEIAERIERRLDAGRRLEGRRVLVTAGGTREPLDAVRYLGNRSSGRMGVAVADEAARRGAQVTLILAAGGAAPSAPMRTLQAESAEQLHRATLAEAADRRRDRDGGGGRRLPACRGRRRQARQGRERWLVELEPTVDILAELGRTRRDGQLLIGFAAEHGEGAVERARAKLERKRADMIVMNDISRGDIGFDSDRQRNRARDVKGGEHCLPALQGGLRIGHLGRRREPIGHRGRRAAYDGLTRGHPVEAHEVKDAAQSEAIAGAGDTARRVIENVARVIQAPEGLLERCVLALLCEGHIILEDFPGRRQDDAGQVAGPLAGLRVRPHPGDAGPAAVRHHRA